MSDSDVAVIGGGLVGASIAWGLVRKGRRVVLFDEGDAALRASRGNFGLVWVQGKGRGRPEYARWSLRSAKTWTSFAAELGRVSGIDVQHENRGGVVLTLNEAEDSALRELLAGIARAVGESRYEYEFLTRAALEKKLPGLGPGVFGGSYSPHDGHASPLDLLRALHAAFLRGGGRYLPGSPVTEIRDTGGGYRIERGGGGRHGAVECDRVVIAAGLATTRLASKVGLYAPTVPVRGHLLITERTETRLSLPTNLVRQTGEGTLQLGYTAEDAGYDTGVRTELLRDVAWRCRTAFPFLDRLRVLRAWSALRIMTPDGFPIYDESPTHPGVHVAACHSGVTLAAVHATVLPEWILGAPLAPELECFRTGRFDVPKAA